MLLSIKIFFKITKHQQILILKSYHSILLKTTIEKGIKARRTLLNICMG